MLCSYRFTPIDYLKALAENIWCCYLECWCGTGHLCSPDQRSWSGKHGRWRRHSRPLLPWPTQSYSTRCTGGCGRKTVQSVRRYRPAPRRSWTTPGPRPAGRSSPPDSREPAASPPWGSEGCWRSGGKTAPLEERAVVLNHVRVIPRR